ncbi:MAG: endonuclease NucS domain-containing protein, partial [Burkholderiales bacterium]
ASGSESYTSRQVYERRMQDKFWGLGGRTPHRKSVRQGDQVVFYVGRPESAFGGTARLTSDSFALTPEQQAQLSHGSAVFTVEYGVWLDSISTWETSRPVASLAPRLDFIENPTQWWAYLQGGIRQVSEADYGRIVSGFVESGPSAETSSQALAQQALFALEAHLEEFIAHNWSRIAWGASLRLFHDGDQTGRQYPAGTWSIDFLAVDDTSNDLVVIELKRGQTSDATVGQVLRYMNWVRENVASAGQNVRGIIVAAEIDEALRYAAKGLPNVSVQTYTVTFALQPVQL